jgi:hypothetical protein
MQGTRAISFEKCGRRFSLDNFLDADTVSGRAQNWLDTDGTASGRGVPTFIVSGSNSALEWWTVDDYGKSKAENAVHISRGDISHASLLLSWNSWV